MSAVMENILVDARACHKCPMWRTRQNVVHYQGPAHPRVLFIGEAPGETEDATGLPFQGRAGRNLREKLRLLDARGISYGITNVILCRPEANRFEHRFGDNCLPFLNRTIEAVHPEVIVALGKVAQFFVPQVVSEAWAEDKLYRFLHPMAMGYNPKLWPRWDEDWQRLVEAL